VLLFAKKTGRISTKRCLAAILIGSVLLIAMPLSGNAVAFEKREKVSSGKTQVVARIGKREVTNSELRIELARLGMVNPDLQAEQFALQSIINRQLLVNAARSANIHRKPEAAMRIKAAQDQSLADFYLATASQPPEPTLSEIEDYIANNPGLFAGRKHYEFSVFSLATEKFNVDAMTPLFSETNDFSDLEEVLRAQKIEYVIKPLSQASSTFPTQIRQQLLKYQVGDNIVIKSDENSQIMKIISERAETVERSQWPVIARRILIEEGAVARAHALVDNLKVGTSVTYFRPELIPAKAVKAKPIQKRTPVSKQNPSGEK